MDLFLDQLPSPVGILHFVHDRENLRVLYFDDDGASLHRLIARHYASCRLSTGTAPSAILQALGAYFDGDLTTIDAIPVATGGTEFQRMVWTALRRIPASRTVSYGALAAEIGMPSATRAVGLACGANPIGIVVPCHRVIGSDGRLTGYGGGIERKRWLLAHERSVTEPSLFELLPD